MDYIYGDCYSPQIQHLLGIDDTQFLSAYGEMDYGAAATWRKSFAERLFSLDNKDELENESRLNHIQKTEFQ
ncbi:hypothetical protein D3C78_1584170 [compost metagenome]